MGHSWRRWFLAAAALSILLLATSIRQPANAPEMTVSFVVVSDPADAGGWAAGAAADNERENGDLKAR